jgi:predicted RNase H-like nuclease (RuvC/YqgF family)
MAKDKTDISSDESQPTAQLDSLASEVAEMRGMVSALLDDNKALRDQLSQVTQQQAAKPSPLLSAQLQETEARLDARLQAHEKALAEAEAALEAGQFKFSVELKGNPTRTVGVDIESQAEAVDKYRKFYGIRSSEHQFLAKVA